MLFCSLCFLYHNRVLVYSHFSFQKAFKSRTLFYDLRNTSPIEGKSVAYENFCLFNEIVEIFNEAEFDFGACYESTGAFVCYVELLNLFKKRNMQTLSMYAYCRFELLQDPIFDKTTRLDVLLLFPLQTKENRKNL